jgi:hypothetical protein
MSKYILMMAAASVIPAMAHAQTAAPVAAPMQAAAPQLVLPANTEIAVTPNDNLTSKGMKEGDTFLMSTVFDVMYNGYVIIPKGTPGQGHLSYRTGKGAFGKSAKMELSFDWLDLNGRRITLTGKHRQEGEGNTGATVAAVATVWVAAPFITGKSAKVPHGMQLSARTAEALPIIVPAGAVPVPTAGIAAAAGATQTMSAPPTTPTAK